MQSGELKIWQVFAITRCFGAAQYLTDINIKTSIDCEGFSTDWKDESENTAVESNWPIHQSLMSPSHVMHLILRQLSALDKSN
jgi:hypothetical protein